MKKLRAALLQSGKKCAKIIAISYGSHAPEAKAMTGLPPVALRRSERTGCCDPSAANGVGFLPRAALRNICSRQSRMAALKHECAVFAANGGWYRGSFVFRPESGREAFFIANHFESKENHMREQLEQIRLQALAQIHEALDGTALEAVRVRVLGKKGELTALLKQMGKLSAEERPVMGQLANGVREALEERLEQRKRELDAAALERRLEKEALDVTVPGKEIELGHQHPMNRVLQEVKEIFIGMGYKIVDGPEIEDEAHNFTLLNTEPGHPARDRSDTFYFNDENTVLLRTQTSPMQIRVMESQKPPIRILAPGRVFRKDEADATHSPMFHQIEGLVIDEGITMSDLKGALETLIKRLYGEDAVVRFRPHHFPFTEPSCEVDMQCFKCHGTGEVNGQVCSTCHGEGWIELLGGGMVHPNVLENCGIDPDKYSGFAFGIGLERMAMGRLKLNDLRLIFDNDIRFLSQF